MSQPKGTPALKDREDVRLRDWFAGQALAGYCANPHAWEEKDHRETAEMAYKIADAMLVAMDRS